jgi:hypothetical protein
MSTVRNIPTVDLDDYTSGDLEDLPGRRRYTETDASSPNFFPDLQLRPGIYARAGPERENMKKTPPEVEDDDMLPSYNFDYSKAKPNRFAAASQQTKTIRIINREGGIEQLEWRSPTLPVACSLTEPELREREATVLASVSARVREVKDLESGYAFRFDPEADLIPEIATLIDLERRCCPFLRFGLTVTPGNGPVWLELTGPEGTREFLRTVFDLP